MKAILPFASARAVQAAAARLKWHYLRYEQAETDAWEGIVKSYQFAEDHKLGRENVAAQAAAHATSVEREFVKALMLAASSPDCLLPREIELAERIIGYVGGDFVLSKAHQPRVTYYHMDLARGAPPRRLTDTPPTSPKARFFAAGAAEARLDELIRVAERGGVPSALNLGDDWESATVLRLLRHLKTCWAATPPVRKHDRHAVKHRVSVIHDFAGVLASVRQGAIDALDPAAGAGTESWMTENISAGGMGLVPGKDHGDWLRVGRLLGVRVEGGSGSCAAGIIRRCSRLQQQVSVGIRTLAKETFAVTLDGLASPEALLLLNDGGHAMDEALVCLAEGAYNPRVSAKLQFNGKAYLLMPQELCETGEDFELARYRVMQQS